MRRHHRMDPEQIPLWCYCDVCGGFHYGLGSDMWGRAREHRACTKAMDRWAEVARTADWSNHVNRAAL